MNNTTTSIYDTSFSHITRPLSTIITFFAVCGLCGNGMIVTVTWIQTSGRLKAKSNHLIAILATCEFVTNIGLLQVG